MVNLESSLFHGVTLAATKPLTVTVHGAVRPAARPPSDKVVVPVGIQPIARGNFKWLDAVTIHGQLGREL
jgi:hypothetical protein